MASPKAVAGTINEAARVQTIGGRLHRRLWHGVPPPLTLRPRAC
ncbi:MAG: hypothetical protein AVDCRST_MAG19-2409 [uncultured Thermomicrobiales bacterium]|uniref:Uncharacterized protein n=1 Tax=uncultured Thermomicrobiales bacterium TaxID=1645740 RepID=A0A6J4V3C6_9BACT|nr:MAG: hypothetical protein AVDCRST_MAG19-2409 [uncultured Thermomicrobiales bacterium]